MTRVQERRKAARRAGRQKAVESLPLELRQAPVLDPERWRAAGGRPTCRGCIAHCCRYVSVEIDPPKAKWQYDQVYWMLLHEAVSVYEEMEGGWFVEFRTRCRALSEHNLCSTYETRPNLCREYSNESCGVWNKERLYRVRFDDAASFAHWLDTKKVNWRFNWQKEAVRRQDGAAAAGAPGEELPAATSLRRRRPRSRAGSGGRDRAPARSARE